MKTGDQVQLSDGVKGTIVKMHPGGRSLYLELEDGRSVTAFVADVTVIESPEETASDLRNEGIAAKAEPSGIEVDISKAPPDA
jgi:hypothetical protein